VITAYVPGVFDMLHIGHIRIFERAREYCDELIAGVVTDEVAEQAKGRRPIVCYEERAAIVSSLRAVDCVAKDISSDKRIMWEILKFDIIVKGNDWEGTPKGEFLERSMAEVGARVVYLPYTEHVSSSLLRSKRFGAATTAGTASS
jgi:glycerol-3-phosphate cytidylyltransferase